MLLVSEVLVSDHLVSSQEYHDEREEYSKVSQFLVAWKQGVEKGTRDHI